MSFGFRGIRNGALAALAACGFSCAHTPEPDPHVHLSAPALPLNSFLVVRGNVSDATTGEPIPYADVYVIDARHENWEHLESHSARLGTANREGRIDLAATWGAKTEPGAEPIFMAGYGRWSDTPPVVDAAEARCREGMAPSVAIVLSHSLYKDGIILRDPPFQFTGSGDAIVLDLGNATLSPRPQSDYSVINSILEEKVGVPDDTVPGKAGR